MIFYDGIIYALQQGGGITVLFNELLERMPRDLYRLEIPKLRTPFDRYRKVQIKGEYELFHSTYYRLPDKYLHPVVTTVHDFTYERYVKGARKLVHTWQKNRAIASSDKIICVSESTKRDLLEFCGERFEDRISVIYNGVSDSYMQIPSIPRECQVLFVGARAGYKNFDATIEAFSSLNDLSLVCVGGGEWTKAELGKLEKLLPGRYRHAGFLSNEALNAEFNKSICLIYPSLYEGFGIPVLEAMRSGCPVVAVNSSSVPEIAADGAYLMELGNPDEIKQGIEFFMVEENRKQFVERGFERASLFSWDVTFQRTIAVYEELLERKLLEMQ